MARNIVLWNFTKTLAEHDPTLFLCLSELNLVVIVKAWFDTVRVLLLLQDRQTGRQTDGESPHLILPAKSVGGECIRPLSQSKMDHGQSQVV